MRTFASLFSGGGLADVGAIQASYKPIWAVEYDASIAGVYRRNIGEHIIVAPCQDVGYASLESPYWLHMSPPCINASQANTQAGETEMDMELAAACVRAIATLQPPTVSLENVWFYRNFASFARILQGLADNGYAFKFWHLNAANFGVPQTRKRLFLVASRIRQPVKPAHTRRKARDDQQLSFFPLPNWVGWYEAIEDLIPGLPDDEFAPWQIPRLPAEMRSMLIAQGKCGVLVRNDNQKQEWGKGYRDDGEPAITITGKGIRAYLVNDNSKVGCYAQDEPAMTRVSSRNGVRAFLLMTGNTQKAKPTGTGIKQTDEPANTVTTGSAGARAFLADGQTNSNGQSLTVRGGDERFITASATQDKRPIRAHVGWRVVRMTARAVARFQSVPDSYELTGIKSLDFRVIGNGVPCLMQQRLMEAQE